MGKIVLPLDPLMRAGCAPFKKNFSGSQGWEVASKIHSQLTKLGYSSSLENLFYGSCSEGLGGVFMRLKVERNWHRLFEDYPKCLYFDGKLTPIAFLYNQTQIK